LAVSLLEIDGGARWLQKKLVVSGTFCSIEMQLVLTSKPISQWMHPIFIYFATVDASKQTPSTNYYYFETAPSRN
jgi:hypothetical protein